MRIIVYKLDGTRNVICRRGFMPARALFFLPQPLLTTSCESAVVHIIIGDLVYSENNKKQRFWQHSGKAL
jgi:hypothetical protein